MPKKAQGGNHKEGHSTFPNKYNVPFSLSELNSPVTVDLNGVVAIRAAPADMANSTELVLSNSRRVGEEAAAVINCHQGKLNSRSRNSAIPELGMATSSHVSGNESFF